MCTSLAVDFTDYKLARRHTKGGANGASEKSPALTMSPAKRHVGFGVYQSSCLQRFGVQGGKLSKMQDDIFLPLLPFGRVHKGSSVATGGTHLGPLVVCCSCWGKACRSVPPSLPVCVARCACV
jgi:hypothetical protein